MNRNVWLFGIVLMTGVLGSAARAEAPPLFDSQAPLDLRITAPFKELRRADKETWFPGKLSQVGGKDFDVELRARGKFRLDLCKMPPLWIKFDKDQVKGTVFEDQRRAKLVSFCRDNDKYEELIVLEYLVYRMYNLITEDSYRVRPAQIVYVESDDGDASPARFSILLEHKRLLDKRLGTDSLDVKQVEAADLNPSVASDLEMFQYMIGNTDWSDIRGPQGEDCCHNVHLFVPDGQGVAKGTVIPIAYDFDQTGFVNPPYAEVNPDLKIRSVRDRLYRGWCQDPAVREATYARFFAQRSAIESMIRAQEGLSDRNRNKALKWIADYYEIAENPKSRERRIDSRCRD